MSDELAFVRALHPDHDTDASVLAAERRKLMAAIETGSDLAPGEPRIIPHLIYEDVAGAIEWLSRAFGFVEREEARMLGADGSVGHAELVIGRGSIMLGPPSIHGDSPRRGVSAMIHVYVPDADGHCARARAEGATIVLEPEDQPWGERRYQATDPEGHQWQFSHKLRG